MMIREIYAANLRLAVAASHGGGSTAVQGCQPATKVSQVFPSHEKNYPPMKHYPALKLILLAVAATADVMYAFYRVKNC